MEKGSSRTLGGRYTGHIITHNLADIITGGPDLHPIEEALAGLMPAGVTMLRPTPKPGPGVDTARFDNIMDVATIGPTAIVVNGRWHECQMPSALPVIAVCSRIPGFEDAVQTMLEEPDVRAEEKELRRWDERVHELLDWVPSTAWLSVVDCHK